MEPRSNNKKDGWPKDEPRNVPAQSSHVKNQKKAGDCSKQTVSISIWQKGELKINNQIEANDTKKLRFTVDGRREPNSGKRGLNRSCVVFPLVIVCSTLIPDKNVNVHPPTVSLLVAPQSQLRLQRGRVGGGIH